MARTTGDLQYLDRQIADIMGDLGTLLDEPTKAEDGELLEGQDRLDVRHALATLRRIRERIDATLLKEDA